MPTYKYLYAVKFICTSHVPNTSQTSAMGIAGSYSTVVEIHNPHNRKIRLRKKLANAAIISTYFSDELEPDAVSMIHCGHVADFGIVAIHGFEGFLVIESTHSLDVTAMYGAGSSDGISSIAVEQIKERKLSPFWPW